ncbi:hypothetical protein CLOM_g7432 [Closterium sp. NIES-68]|nr:hypothetical protein CLOM_g7432 [Closterium sp. NIES-68]GJP83694.1 hypothetical protein CLOP_g13820 [Closterium sp. NIES-67]
MVVNVWPFLEANSQAWEVLTRGGSALDAVVEGCNACEVLQCDGSVGYGGSPDENGETTLDAMVMDGNSMDVGAVAGMRRVKAAVRAAYFVLLHTQHSLLVGDAATEFALSMGLEGPEDLSTNRSLAMWRRWKADSCQPNYWRNVTPDAARSCGPYRPATVHTDGLNGPELDAAKPHAAELRGAEPQGAEPQGAEPQGAEPQGAEPQGAEPRGAEPHGATDVNALSKQPAAAAREGRGRSLRRTNKKAFLEKKHRLVTHDTISMVAIAQNGAMAAATSTNGLTFHVPGRVGDAPIPGAGAYVDSSVGGCGATGDGDIMMRFLPCFLAVELMRMGSSPASAAEAAISRIRAKFPDFQGGLVAVNRFGEHGAAVNNWVLQYTVASPVTGGTPKVFTVHPKDVRAGAI